MRINSNIMAMNAHRQLGMTGLNSTRSMERLSSGFRINRAGDDAAGLAISEKMRAQVRGLNQASRNAQDGISMLQTAEGALNETQSILQRMREIAGQAASDTNVGIDRNAIASEINQLVQEIDRIANTTQFNTRTLLTGDLATSITNAGTNLTASNGIADLRATGANAGVGFSVTVANGSEITVSDGTDSQMIDVGALPTGFDTREVNFAGLGITLEINSQLSNFNADNTFDVSATGNISLFIGANEGNNLNISMNDMRANALGVDTLDVSTASDAESAVTTINSALESVSSERSTLGAFQNRLEYTIRNLDNTAENLQSAESRIRDVDMASEMMNFTKQNILQQAATAMLVQANARPQSILQLLG